MSNEEIIEIKYKEAVKEIKEDWFITANSQWSKWYDYIIELPTDLQITYLIVIFDNQVSNGGFHQYFANGYGQFARETINALIEIGALKKAQLLKEALRDVNSEEISYSIFRERLLKKEIDELFISDDLFEPLNNLDTQYD